MTDYVFRHRDCWREDGTPKKRYQRRRDAKRAARRTGNGNGVYRCSQCDHYHVGHPPRRD